MQHVQETFQSLMGATGRSNAAASIPNGTFDVFQSLMGATGRSNVVLGIEEKPKVFVSIPHGCHRPV